MSSTGTNEGHRAAWLREARYGVFAHYLHSGDPKRDAAEDVAEWNRQIDAFDVDGLVRDLTTLEVPLFGITTGQNSGHWMSPNATYDRLVGIEPSKCSRRDLIGEIAQALRGTGTRMMVYFISHAPAKELQAIRRLRCCPPWSSAGWGYPGICYGQMAAEEVGADARLKYFQTSWQSILSEWTTRWGRDVSYYWVDGCYYVDQMYRHLDEPNFASFCRALRAGNPEALVSFNEGVRTRPVPMPDSGRDVTSGEVDFAFPMSGRWHDGSEAWSGPLIGGEQLQVFSFLGRWWGQGPPRMPIDLCTAYTRYVNDTGGFMLWDLPLTRQGRIETSFAPHLEALRPLRRR